MAGRIQLEDDDTPGVGADVDDGDRERSPGRAA
jgi:hypothetical protein